MSNLSGNDCYDKNWFCSQADINAYLAYRSIPGPIRINDNVLKASNQPIIKKDKNNLIEQGVQKLSKTFEKVTDTDNTSSTHVVPLSGGIDSRTILGGVLDNVDRDRIVTITFGTPGTYDFELGQKVAEHVGVENYAIDLTPGKFSWTEDRMIRSAAAYDRPTVLFRARTTFEYAFNELLDVENPVYWSGFMGDAVCGGHLPEKKSETWSEAIKSFLPMNLKCPHLTAPSFDPLSILPDEPAVSQDILSYDEQLDFGIRQPYYISPSAIYRSDFETPYLREPFLSFILNVPRRHRVDRKLFKEIVAATYPKLYEVPTESMEGLSIRASESHRKARVVFRHIEDKLQKVFNREQPSRNTQHLDWNYELRNSSQLQTLVFNQLENLDNRKCVDWIDCVELYQNHQNGSNLGRELKLLTSLEIFLKVYYDGRLS